MPLRIPSWIDVPSLPQPSRRIFYNRRHGAANIFLPFGWRPFGKSSRRMLSLEQLGVTHKYQRPYQPGLDGRNLTVRQYTSLVKPALIQSSTPFDWFQLLGKDNVPDTDPARNRLLSMIRDGIPEPGGENYDDVWEAYNELEDQRDWEIIVETTNYFSFSTREQDKMRILLLVDNNEAPQNYFVWKNTVLSLYLRKVDRAFDLYRKSLTLGESMHHVPELILAHAIRSNDWHIARACFSAAVNTQTIPEKLWSYTFMLPNPFKWGIKFLEWSRESHPPKKLAQHLSAIVLSRIPPAQTSFDRFLFLVREQDLEDKFLYEASIMHLLNLARSDPSSATILQCLQKLWSSYRKFCLPGNVNQHLIQNLLRAFTTFRASWASTDQNQRGLVLDILKTCSLKHIPLDYEVLVSLMDMYAWRGNVESVMLLNSHLHPKLEEIQGLERDEIQRHQDIRRLVCLIRVHAVRADVARAETQFNYIRRIYPAASKSIYIWREMLRLYANSQKFDMAFKTAFEIMPEAKVPLDKVSLMSLLWLCGWSGDPGGALSLLSIAQKSGIKLDPWILRYLVLAFLKNHETAYADALLSQISPNKNALTALWNGRLAIFASRRDVKSVNSLYHQMAHLDIPKSRQTYLILIRMFSTLGGADEAAHILNQIIPRESIVVDSSFFSLLVRAYAKDLRFEEAIKAYSDMLTRGFVPDIEARTQYLLSKAMLLRSNPAYDKAIVDELKQMLNDQGENITWRKTEASVWFRCRTDNYFASLILAYSEVGAVHVVQAIKEEYWRHHSKIGDPPLGVLHAFIKSASLLNEHDVIDELWAKCLSQLRNHALEMARYSRNLSVAAKVLSNTSSENGPVEQTDRDKISPSVKGLLSRPLTSYLHSMASRKQFNLMVSTVEEVLSEGFTLNNHAVNCYIQLLCDSPDPHIIITAFKTAEYYIMPNFQPLQKLGPTEQDKSKNQRLMAFTRDELHPEPRTLFALKASWLAAVETTLPGSLLGVDQHVVRLSDILQQAAPSLSHVMANYKKYFGEVDAPQTYTPQHMVRAMAEADKRRESPSESGIRQVATAMSFSDVNELLLSNDTTSSESEDVLGWKAAPTDNVRSAWDPRPVEASRGSSTADTALQERIRNVRASLGLDPGDESELTAAQVFLILGEKLDPSNMASRKFVSGGEYALSEVFSDGSNVSGSNVSDSVGDGLQD